MPEFTKEQIEARGFDEYEKSLFDGLNDENDNDGVGRRFMLESPDKPVVEFISRELDAGHIDGVKAVVKAMSMAMALIVMGAIAAQKSQDEGTAEVDPNE